MSWPVSSPADELKAIMKPLEISPTDRSMLSADRTLGFRGNSTTQRPTAPRAMAEAS
jgi:hypothetical protein